jgi:hypothetical protein
MLPERLRSVSFLLYSIVRWQKWGGNVTRGQSTKFEIEKKKLKIVLFVSKTTLQHFLYRILTQFG